MSYVPPDGSLIASAAYTTTQNSPAQNSQGAFKGVKVVLDITNIVTAASQVLTIEVYDPASNKWVTVLTGAAVTATGTTSYNVHPQMTAAANVTANLQLPVKWRATVTPGNANAITYSVGSSTFLNQSEGRPAAFGLQGVSGK
jgi:hypothetical protein